MTKYTEQALWLAGLEPGMRVLDVGSGPGDVSFAAARIVGPTGAVTGIDAEPSMVAFATTRAAEQQLSTVSFVRRESRTSPQPKRTTPSSGG